MNPTYADHSPSSPNRAADAGITDLSIADLAAMLVRVELAATHLQTARSALATLLTQNEADPPLADSTTMLEETRVIQALDAAEGALSAATAMIA